MDEWVRAQVAAGLPAFRGSAIAGTVAVNQELLNELLAQWLAAQAQGGGAATGAPDVRQLLPFLKQAAVRAEAGRVLVDFEVSVGERDERS
jgi:hypothetical protein